MFSLIKALLIASISSSILTSIDASCPDGWVNNFGKCYLTTVPKKSYHNCLYYCADFEATLPCVMNTAENAFIASIYYNADTYADLTVYLGLNDIVTEGTFQWQAGCASTLVNFAPGEPNNSHGGEDCTAVYTNGLTFWNDLPCSVVAYCVCEKPEDNSPSVAPSAVPTKVTTVVPTATPTAAPSVSPTVVPMGVPTNAACPDGWVNNFGKCYLTTVPKKSYLNCKYYCADFQATLPCVMNTAENAYIASIYYYSDIPLYLGLNDIKTEGTFKWQTGCTSTMINFAPGEPNELYSGEDCTVVYTNGFTFWNDQPCDVVSYCVCEKPADSSHLVVEDREYL